MAVTPSSLLADFSSKYLGRQLTSKGETTIEEVTDRVRAAFEPYTYFQTLTTDRHGVQSYNAYLLHSIRHIRTRGLYQSRSVTDFEQWVHAQALCWFEAQGRINTL